jgi:hypothetical protein
LEVFFFFSAAKIGAKKNIRTIQNYISDETACFFSNLTETIQNYTDLKKVFFQQAKSPVLTFERDENRTRKTPFYPSR